MTQVPHCREDQYECFSNEKKGEGVGIPISGDKGRACVSNMAFIANLDPETCFALTLG
jgi:hypothetical protein